MDELEAPMPPFLAPYAYRGANASSSGAGSSSSIRRRTPKPSPSLFTSEESEEEANDMVVYSDFVASDEAEARAHARMQRRSMRAHFREVAREDAELEEVVRLIEGQTSEEEAVRQLQWCKKAEERTTGVIVIDDD